MHRMVYTMARMPQYLPITKVRQQLLGLAAELGEDGRIVVTRNGRPVFDIVQHERLEELESLVETAEIIADPDMAAALRRGMDDARRGDVVDWDTVRGEFG